MADDQPVQVEYFKRMFQRSACFQKQKLSTFQLNSHEACSSLLRWMAMDAQFVAVIMSASNSQEDQDEYMAAPHVVACCGKGSDGKDWEETLKSVVVLHPEVQRILLLDQNLCPGRTGTGLLWEFQQIYIM